ncbi:MAG: hypothetical protein COZ01_10945 [Zetaproteobacteria bacterium CG_4_10_14_0_8_um_filter_55_43]|nr:MAG: hypothetical protein COZ01_10945 [Zetaproteobacteria bacterium CG_4_10_14_0_8_um_filter_55_43]
MCRKCGQPYHTEWGGSSWVWLLLATLCAVSMVFLIPTILYPIWVFASREKVCLTCGREPGNNDDAGKP